MSSSSRSVTPHETARGFSLLELLVAFAIVGLLSTVAALNLCTVKSQLVCQHTLASAAQLLERAVFLSLLRSSPHQVTFNHTTARLANDSKSVLQEVSFGHHAYHQPLKTESETNVFFYPTGVSSPKSIEFVCPARTCQLIISLRGRLRTVCH